MVACSKQPKSQTGVRKVTRGGKEVTVYPQLSKIDAAALKWINHHLKSNPSSILVTKANLEAGELVTDDSKRAQEKDSFHATYQHFSQLPLYWIADYFVTKLEIPKEKVDAIEAFKSSQLREMLEFFTGIAPCTQWWPNAKNKTVLVAFLDYLVNLCGNRHKGFVAHVSPSGKINWLAAGPFDLEWSAPGEGTLPLLILMKHTTTKSEVRMEKYQIERSSNMIFPWSDMRAQFTDDTDNASFLNKYFPKVAAFKEWFDKSKMQDKAKILFDEHKSKEVAKVIGETEILVTSKKQKGAKLKALMKTPAAKSSVPLTME